MLLIAEMAFRARNWHCGWRAVKLILHPNIAHGSLLAKIAAIAGSAQDLSMLVEKAAAGVKVLIIPRGQRDVFGSRQALRIGDHLGGRGRTTGLDGTAWNTLRVINIRSCRCPARLGRSAPAGRPGA